MTAKGKIQPPGRTKKASNRPVKEPETAPRATHNRATHQAHKSAELSRSDRTTGGIAQTREGLHTETAAAARSRHLPTSTKPGRGERASAHQQAQLRRAQTARRPHAVNVKALGS
jgi:hypothetical protein